jgi:hypothetical protein
MKIRVGKACVPRAEKYNIEDIICYMFRRFLSGSDIIYAISEYAVLYRVFPRGLGFETPPNPKK